MTETQQTMTEFTVTPGEKNIIGDRFSPSVIIFWLKTSIAASSTRIQYRTSSGSSSPTSRDCAIRKAWTWPRSGYGP